MRARLALLIAVLVALTAPATVAWAHASLADSDPKADAVVAELPERVTLTFTEEISPPAYAVVTAPSGERVSTGRVRVAGRDVSVAVAGAETGEFTVAYRVVSVDGHPVSGSFGFTVAGDGTAAPAVREPADSAAEEPSFWVRHRDHLLWSAVLVLVAGGLLWLERRRSRR